MNIFTKPSILITTSSFLTIGLVFYALSLIGKNVIITISDLGTLKETAIYFKIAILSKAIFDVVWLKRINEDKAIFYLYPLFFSMLAFMSAENEKLLHWGFAILYFMTFIYFQLSKINTFKYGKSFVFFQIIVAAIGTMSETFYLFSETLVFLTIVLWQLAYSLKFQQSKSLLKLNK